jgi:hypothetical protein
MKDKTGMIRDIKASDFHRLIDATGITEDNPFSCIRSGNQFVLVGYELSEVDYPQEKTSAEESQLVRTKAMLDILSKGIASRVFTGKLQVAAMKMMHKLKLESADLEEKISGTKKDYAQIAANLEKKIHNDC